MPTAWQVLISSSTLPDNGINTAWDHLNNQQGGGQNYYITEEVIVDELTQGVSIEAQVPVISVEEILYSLTIEEVTVVVSNIETEGSI